MRIFLLRSKRERQRNDEKICLVGNLQSVGARHYFNEDFKLHSSAAFMLHTVGVFESGPKASIGSYEVT